MVCQKRKCILFCNKIFCDSFTRTQIGRIFVAVNALELDLLNPTHTICQSSLYEYLNATAKVLSCTQAGASQISMNI